jgi:selenophosphate synthase
MVTYGDVAEYLRWVLADAQTSGGLLIAVSAPLSEGLLQALEDEGAAGSVIGRIVEKRFEHGPSGRIFLS